MQQELASPTNGNPLLSAIPSLPFSSPDQGLSSSPYMTNGGDYLGLYSMFSPKEMTPTSLTPVQGSASVSVTPSSVSFDGEDPMATENCLYLAGLSLQYQEIEDRLELCLSHLQEATREAEALRQENAQLRIANGELTKRLNLLPGKPNVRIATPPTAYPAMSIVEEFRRLNVGSPPAETSPTSVLGLEGIRFGKRPPEKRVSLPKSISIRSSGYLKLNQSSGTGSPSNRSGHRSGRHRVSSPVMLGSQRVYVGKKGAEAGEVGRSNESGLELEVYNQGMFKTELCNKWQESGECPYWEHCQFAHGIGELRPVIRHPRYKTEVCRMVLAGDTCPYGHRCHFRHALSPHDRFLLPGLTP